MEATGGRTRESDPAASSGAGGRLALLALATAGALWGLSFLFGKWALEEIGPAHVTLLRFALASAVLLPYALHKGVRPRRRDLPLFVVVGFLTVPATFLVQFWGLSLTSATVAALIVGCGPPMIALFGRLFLEERLGRHGWAAVGASTAGVAATGWVLACGTLALAPVAFVWEGVPRVSHLTMTGWGSVAVLGLGCSAATYALWNWGARRVPASRAGVFLNLEPLVGALLGVLVLGDAWGPGRFSGERSSSARRWPSPGG